MEFTLPTNFDVIVIGTGFIESLLSAAISRIGKQVLHIDSKDYYGDHWASFNLENINKIVDKTNLKDFNVEDIKHLLEDSEVLQFLGNNKCDLQDVEQTWHVEKTSKLPVANNETELENVIEGNVEPQDKAQNVLVEKTSMDDLKDSKPESWSQDLILNNSRRFNLDLSPKLHFARGAFVELMISANLSRYSEFRSVSRVLTWLNGNLESVPCSRSDVFSNDKVSVIEKRMLMKLLVACVESEPKEFAGYENKTFYTYLKDHKLTDNLIHYVLYTIAMSTKETLCLEGVENTKRFLQSLGRFGKTPLLYAMYGSGDLAQAFCRCSAVFGGIFALNQNLKSLIIDKENKFKAIVCGDQRLNAKYLIMGAEKAPKPYVENIKLTYTSRATFITDRSMWETEKEHLTLLVFPPENDKSSCITIEMGTLTGTCPKTLYLIHMIAKQTTNPKEDFSSCVEKLFGSDNSPKVLWSIYYSMPDTNHCDLNINVPENVLICPGPDRDLDYDNSIQIAKSMFEKLYPEEPFFPRVPDPEEIIFAGGDDEETNSENNSEVKEEEKPISTDETHEDDIKSVESI